MANRYIIVSHISMSATTIVCLRRENASPEKYKKPNILDKLKDNLNVLLVEKKWFFVEPQSSKRKQITEKYQNFIF